MDVPQTEGIKYAGSKLRLLPHILNVVGDLKGIHTVLDGFSGSTRVSQAFSQSGYAVTANDISVWSEVFGNCYLVASKSPAYYQRMIAHLNALSGVDGWFTLHYGGKPNDMKRAFQVHNTRKLDAIRTEIDKMDVDWADKCVLLTSLILALDKVDSTLGHFAAYLSKWSPRSFNEMKLKLPLRLKTNEQNRVFRDDVFNTINKDAFDLAYFDPPYGSNNEKMPPSRIRYAAYYHFWTTIIKNDCPETFGKAERRVDSRDFLAGSVFEEFRKDKNGNFLALDALRKLIQETNARYLLFSYSSDGRASMEQIAQMMRENGELLTVMKIDHRMNVMSSMCWTNEWLKNGEKHQEYLFLMKK